MGGNRWRSASVYRLAAKIAKISPVDIAFALTRRDDEVAAIASAA